MEKIVPTKRRAGTTRVFVPQTQKERESFKRKSPPFPSLGL